jgi:hypothetical protein
MSYYLLAGGDVGEAPEYTVDRTFTYSWGIYAGVSAEFTYLWNILAAVQAQFTYKWNIYAYVSRQFTYIWNIGYYIQREFTYLWNIYSVAADIGKKVKYSFRTSSVVNRFYRMFRA